MLRVPLLGQSTSVILGGEPHGACGSTAPSLAAKLLVVDRIRLTEALVLRLGELDALGPATDGADRNAEARCDHPEGETILTPEPPRLFPLHRFHEHMFAYMPDGENYTQGAYAPMV